MNLRIALRSLRRNPGFTALAVLVMALGIGVNTAIFSVVNAVILRPLGYRDADRIVTLSSVWKNGGDLGKEGMLRQVSIPDFHDWHDRSTAFDAMAYFDQQQTSAASADAAEYTQVARVSPEFFEVFQVRPMVGRMFTAQEMEPGSGGAALISHAYWQSHFNRDPAALGRRVRVFGHSVTIVGVLPGGFGFPNDTAIWLPSGAVVAELSRKIRSALNYEAVARLKPDVTLEQAQEQLSSISARIEQEHPDSNAGRGVAAMRLRDDMVSNVRLTLYILQGAVSMVLLMACANTATLLLARAAARTREIAIRAAVGATRARIIRQLAGESLLLAIIAGAAGLLLALWGSEALVRLAPGKVPRLDQIGIDRWVLGFTLLVSMAASVLFGLAPALHASRVDLNEALKQGGTRAAGGRSGRMREILVVCEIALCVVLLAGAGLLIKSFIALHNVALGFRPENVLVMQTSAAALGYTDPHRADDFFENLLGDILPLPGVLAAGATMAPPGHVETVSAYWIDRLPQVIDTSGTPFVASVITPGTFAALGIPLKRGRDFDRTDDTEAPRTAIVNEALVRKSFANQNPIGRTIFCISDSVDAMKIVGVVGDVRQYGPAREPMPECYLPYRQHRYNGATLSVVVRSSGDPARLAEAMRRQVRQRSSDVSVKFTTMDALLAENVAAPRFRSLLFGIFGGLAVCLAMAGIYGLMSYMVGQRSSEIGLRMALGASPGDVLRLMVREGLLLAGIGLALGLAGAAAVTRMLASFLFNVQPLDLGTYSAVAILLALVSWAAVYLPARRAARLDPLLTLRQE